MSSPALSTMSAAIYAAAALAAAAAAWRTRAPRATGRMEWAAIAGAFATLAVIRFLNVEDRLRNAARGLARQEGEYDLRADWQRPLVALLLIGGIIAILLVWRRRQAAQLPAGSRHHAGPAVATIGMLLLLMLRLVSLHGIDALLYRGGMFSLNHLLDTGLALFVLAAALAALRMRPAPRRKRSID